MKTPLMTVLFQGLLFFTLSCTQLSDLDHELERLREKEGTSPYTPTFPLKEISHWGKVAPSLELNTKVRPYKNYSPQKLYFAMLWEQYEDLKNYTQKSSLPEISICSNYHSLLLDLREKRTSQGFLEKKTMKDHPFYKKVPSVQALVLYPELALTEGKKSVDESGLDRHLIHLYLELDEMCRYGSSSNSYSFENLVTSLKEYKKFKGESVALKTLFKTLLYKNYLLLFSLKLEFYPEKSSVKSLFSSSLAQEVLIRLDALWSTVYFDHLERVRLEQKKSNASTIFTSPL